MAFTNSNCSSENDSYQCCSNPTLYHSFVKSPEEREYIINYHNNNVIPPKYSHTVQQKQWFIRKANKYNVVTIEADLLCINDVDGFCDPQTSRVSEFGDWKFFFLCFRGGLPILF